MAEKETLAAYKRKLSRLLSGVPKGTCLPFFWDEDAPYRLVAPLKKAQRYLSMLGIIPATAQKPLLIMADRVERTGRWALAAEALGYWGIILYPDANDEAAFLLTFFGNSRSETVPIHLEDLALPAHQYKGRALFALGLLLHLLQPANTLLFSVDHARGHWELFRRDDWQDDPSV